MKKPSRALRLPSGRTTGSNLGGVTETTPQETTGKKKAKAEGSCCCNVCVRVCACARPLKGRRASHAIADSHRH